jgi:hypothetical protein
MLDGESCYRRRARVNDFTAVSRLTRNTARCFGWKYLRVVMKIAIPHSAIRSPLAIHNHGGLIIAGYVLLALVAIYLAAGQPGVAQAELAIATALP